MEKNELAEKAAELTAKPVKKKPRGKPFEAGYDERRNLEGYEKGEKNFNTDFEEACNTDVIIKALETLGVKDAKIALIVKAIIEALRGNFRPLEWLLNKKYGKPTEPIDITTKGESINPLPSEVNEEDKQAVEDFHNALKANMLKRLLKKKQDEDIKGKSASLPENIG